MGASPWFYFVPYTPDPTTALNALREREFQAGRYNPAEDFPQFPVVLSHKPGCQHDSIDEAQEDADADGTRSILDISHIGNAPDYGVVVPMSDDDLMAAFGTTHPTHEQIEENDKFLEDIERGQGILITVYKDGVPSELYFAGYSYD
jgi:hypothetical protein